MEGFTTYLEGRGHFACKQKQKQKEKSMRVLILMMVLLSANCTSCVTDPNRVQKIDTSLEAKGRVDNKTLGIDKDRMIILQEDTSAADALRTQQNVNLQTLTVDLSQPAHSLKRCRTELSDPRLGGNGVIPEMQEIDNMKTPTEIREEIGLDKDGEIKVVKREFFIEKLKLERAYAKSLETSVKTITRHLEECEYKLGQARVKVGLPSKRFIGEVRYVKGGQFVQETPNEGSLDDAFKIQAGLMKDGN